MLFTAAAMVAALNSIVLGTGLSLLLRATDVMALPLAVAVGVIVGCAAFVGQLVLQRRQFALGIGE
jgi:hypothetical protein